MHFGSAVENETNDIKTAHIRSFEVKNASRRMFQVAVIFQKHVIPQLIQKAKNAYCNTNALPKSSHTRNK